MIYFLFWESHISFKCVSWKSSIRALFPSTKQWQKDQSNWRLRLVFVAWPTPKRDVSNGSTKSRFTIFWNFRTRKNWLLLLWLSDFSRLSIEVIEYARFQNNYFGMFVFSGIWVRFNNTRAFRHSVIVFSSGSNVMNTKYKVMKRIFLIAILIVMLTKEIFCEITHSFLNCRPWVTLCLVNRILLFALNFFYFPWQISDVISSLQFSWPWCRFKADYISQ